VIYDFPTLLGFRERRDMQPPEPKGAPVELSADDLDDAALAAIKDNPRYRALAIDTVLNAMFENGDDPEDFL
jgi:hypothetical protein